MLSDVRKGVLKEAPPKAESVVPPAPDAAATPDAPPAEPTPGETPAPEAAEVAPEEASPGDETDDDPNQDGPVTPSEAKKLRLRLRQDDAVGRLAAAFQQRNRDMSLEEALDKAKAQLGIKPKGAEPTPDAKPKSDLPETIEVVDTTLESLDAEREKALTELRFEDVGKIDRKVRQLDRHRLNLEREGDKRQAQEVQVYETKFTQSEAKAVELYPDAAKADSEFGKRMREIDADLGANGDPLFKSPDKPLRIAQMTAAEKSISPRRKGTPAAPVKPAAPAAVPGPKRGILPSGASRTTPPAANAQPAFNAQVQAVNSVHALRKVLKSVGVR